MLIRRVCAWCGRTQGFVEVSGRSWNEEIPVTHTICPDCRTEVETEILSISVSLPTNDKSE